MSLPWLPPVSPPTAAWDVGVGLVGLAIIGYGYLASVKLASNSLSNSTANSQSNCSQQKPPSPKCKEAADKIDKILKGRKVPGGKDYKSIAQRAQELKDNPQGQPMFWEDANPGVPRPSGSDQFGHLIQIEQQQKELAEALQSYYKENCTNVAADILRLAAEWVMQDPFDML